MVSESNGSQWLDVKQTMYLQSKASQSVGVVLMWQGQYDSVFHSEVQSA